ncbi:MAG: FtsX-like permease family protein [Nocardioidaceae bacterium]
MVLRGILSRRVLSLSIFVLAMLVVSGTVVSVAFSRLTHVSQGSAGALVLLGFVALAAQSVESLRRREHELALARLHGRRGLHLLGFAVAEPCLVVIGGAVGGALAGRLVTHLVIGAWLPAGTPDSLSRQEWLAAGIVTVGMLLLVVASGWRILRAPLLVQLTGARRPRPSTTVGLFFQVLLVVGAVVSIYQAHEASKDRVDWVTLMSPAIAGLAAGQVVIWLVVASLAVVVPRRQSAQLGWFITLRRLSRRADSLAMVRTIVAAGVLFGVAASASTSAQAWREQRSRLQVGAPVSYPVPSGALAAYAASRLADPRGSWLAAVASYTTDESPAGRRVFVDAERWGTVVGDFFADTDVAPLTGALTRLPTPQEARYVTGDVLTATMTSASLPQATYVTISLEYVDDVGDLVIAALPLQPRHAAPAPPGRSRFSATVSGCRLACVVTRIDIAGRTRSPLHLLDVSFAGRHLLAPTSGIQLEQTPFQIRSSRVARGLSVNLRRGFGGFGVDGALATFPSTVVQTGIATPGVVYDRRAGHPSVGGVDGAARPIHVTVTLPALPFVGTRGTLLDLGSVLVGAGGSSYDTDARILARADTPTEVIEALRSTHVLGLPTTYRSTLARLDDTPRAQGTRLYVLVAGFAALIALVSIASAAAQQTSQRRQEAAGLRSAGVRSGQIAGAYRREAAALAVVTFVSTSVAGWAACRVLLPALPLVSGWLFAPPLDATPNLSVIAVTALASGATAGLVTYLAFRSTARSSPPRLLREVGS